MRAGLLVVCLLTVVRIAATHGVFSPTYDEPAHIASGWEYLHHRTYTFDMQHPPLARIFFGFPFRNVTPVVQDRTWIGEVLSSAGSYMKGIVLARRGNLPFVVLAIVAVALWAKELLGPAGAVIACALFAMMPPVLAHGGLATTDMAGTAAFALSMFAMHRWLDDPTRRRTAFLGFTIGIGLLSKLSFPLFFAIGAVVMMAARRRVPVARGLAALAMAFAMLWLVYIKRFDTLVSLDGNAPARATMLFGSPYIAKSMRWPVPEFVNGLLTVAAHDREGHEAYFFGGVRKTGWWYYFPVLLAVKTPLPMLLLALGGSWRQRVVALIAALMLLSAMTSHINLGIRHLLPIYAPLAILAASAVVKWRWRTAPLCAWLVANSLLAHPDYLPWMNVLAGRHPERIAVDSNFDWGQDVLRLADECRRRGIGELHVFLFGTVELPRIGMPPTKPADPYTPSPGWYALSESEVLPAQVRDPAAYFWLTSKYPYDRIGKTIRLYRVP